MYLLSAAHYTHKLPFLTFYIVHILAFKTMATGFVEQAQMAQDSHRARRTEAMPKSSLFGSILEMQTEEGMKSARELDLHSVKLPKTPTGKGAGQKFRLPDDVKKQLPGTP
jgi:hypothetical protein